MSSSLSMRGVGAVAGPCLVALVSLQLAMAQFPVPVPGRPTYPGDPRPPRRSPYPDDRLPREESTPFPRGGPKARGPASDLHTIRTFTGECKEITKEQLTITTADHREFRFALTDKTEFLRDTEEIKPAEIKKGDTVRVTAKQDGKGFLTAGRVQLDTLEGPAHGGATTVARLPEVQANIPDDPEDPGPPTLRRRTPEEIERLHKEKAEQQAKQAELAENQPPPKPLRSMPDPPPPEPKRDPHIEKAREQALKFTEKLPNFICRQVVARYQSLNITPRDWDALDIVEADVVFFEGEEDYQNIKVGYKLVKKKMSEIDGAWSRGEYGTVLRNIFEPWTLTEFRYRGLQMVSGRVGRRYAFNVERSRSQWEARMASESYLPAYKGTISIDEKTHRTLRIEMEAKHFPPDFPMSSIEMTVEYGLVRIGSQYHLLPVHSEIIGCDRYSSMCSLNKIDFRNYRQFSSESTIFTSDSDISFGDKEAPPKTEPQ